MSVWTHSRAAKLLL